MSNLGSFQGREWLWWVVYECYRKGSPTLSTSCWSSIVQELDGAVRLELVRLAVRLRAVIKSMKDVLVAADALVARDALVSDVLREGRRAWPTDSLTVANSVVGWRPCLKCRLTTVEKWSAKDWKVTISREKAKATRSSTAKKVKPRQRRTEVERA